MIFIFRKKKNKKLMRMRESRFKVDIQQYLIRKRQTKNNNIDNTTRVNRYIHSTRA